MKKRKYILKCIVSVIMIGMLVCGCGKEEATVTEESNTEMMEEPVSETSVEEEEAIPEEQVADDAETQESVESTEMVDWETFAAQEGNEDICLVISNEKNATQKVIYEQGCYRYEEGDRIAIPIRNDIFNIQANTAEIDGSLNDNTVFIYSRNEENVAYVEFEIGDQPGYYYILINCESGETLIYTLYKE